MCDKVDTDLDKFFNRQDKNSNDLQFFLDDTEFLFNIIEEQLVRIRDIADGYEIELDDEIKKQYIDILTNGRKE